MRETRMTHRRPGTTNAEFRITNRQSLTTNRKSPTTNRKSRIKSGGGQHAVAGSNKSLEPSVDRRCTWRVLHGVCAGNAANRVGTVHLQAAFIYKRRASARKDGMAGGREMVRPGSTDSGQVIRFSAAVLVHGKLGGCPTWSPDGRRGRRRTKISGGGWAAVRHGRRMAEEDAVRRKFRADGWVAVRHSRRMAEEDAVGRKFRAGGRGVGFPSGTMVLCLPTTFADGWLAVGFPSGIMLSRLWATSLDKRSGATIRPFCSGTIGFGRHFWTDNLLRAAGGASRCGEELASDDSSRETHCAGSGVRGEEK